MAHSRTAERRFYLLFILLIFGAVLLGFSRTLFLLGLVPEWVELHAPKEPFFLLHGTIVAAWFVVLIAQSSLITAGRVDLHRRLGTLSMGLAAAVLVFGVAAAGLPREDRLASSTFRRRRRCFSRSRCWGSCNMRSS